MNEHQHARDDQDDPQPPAADSSTDPAAGAAVSGPGGVDDRPPAEGRRSTDGRPSIDDRLLPDGGIPEGAPVPVTAGSIPVGEESTTGATSGSTAAQQHAAAVATWRDRSKQRRRSGKKRPWWIELPILLVTAFVLTFLIQTFLFKVYYVPSGSMEQTLHGVETGGDRILVNKVVFDFRDPKPGDVVVFKGPPSWTPEANIPGPSSWLGKLGQAVGSVVGIAAPNEKDFVKRVIAVGGQTVKCCDAVGNVQVDGVSLDEPYIYQPFDFDQARNCTSPDKSQRCFGPVKVPVGRLWMMGDHRSNSKDSSFGCQGDGDATFCQGPVPADNVIGKAIFIIMPVSRWDTIGDPGIDHRDGG